MMKHVITTKERGLILKPYGAWDGSKNFVFVISGRSNSDFAKCPTTRRSVSGWSAHLNGAPYTRKSKMQPIVAMSVTEAECIVGTSCIQDMLYGMRFLESLGLQVNKPMIIEIDNKGAVDLFNNWSISRNTRAISVRLAFVRELKEAGIIDIKWIKGEDNSADLFTKNLETRSFLKHMSVYCVDMVDGKPTPIRFEDDSVESNNASQSHD